MLNYFRAAMLNFLLGIAGNTKENIVFFLLRPFGKAVAKSLYMDTTSICNANCIFCSYQYDRRPKAVMDDELFRKAAKDYRDLNGKRIGLTPLLGELFVDPKALEKIRYLHQLGFDSIHAYSNASLFHKFGFTEILCSGLTRLHISLAPLTEEAYKKIFRTNAYKQVLSNTHEILKEFQKLQQDRNSALTIQKILLEFRADRPLGECEVLNDYIQYIKPHIGRNVEVINMVHFDAWTGAIKQEDLLPGMKIKSSDFVKLLPCSRTSVLQLQPNGDVRLCGCRIDTKGERDELYLGNVKEKSLSQLYNSQVVVDIKKSFMTGNQPEVCKKCSWYSA
ncbi:MAG: radical SAM/SPASM domain-containing protein [Candidatus Omnitrophota bacterium]